MLMRPLRLSFYTLTNALGRGVPASLQALQAGRSGLTPCDFDEAELSTWIGRVEGVEDERVQGALSAYDCRNNRLAQLALEQDDFARRARAASAQYGSRGIGVFMGTSTSGIQQTELAYRDRDPAATCLPDSYHYPGTHNVFSGAAFVRAYLNLDGPAQTISTACSSSAKVFAAAYRHMATGLCDAAVVGGVDSLCLLTLYGFNSLQLVSSTPCRPADAQRDGISIGEAAGFAFLEWAKEGDEGIGVLGYGESSDAYHMSSPHPQGAGAAAAMRAALRGAGLPAQAVDYLNLHGTATPANDASEDQAVMSVFDSNLPCSSTKGWTGHTLGAAGITEALFACLSLEQGFMPGTLNTQQLDPALKARVLLHNQEARLKHVMSNSLGFGGSNCSLVLGAL